MNNIIREIRSTKLLKKGMTIVLGLSGGPDSLCLLHALYCLSDEFELKIVPVHINHKFRHEIADAEQKRVEDISRGYGLKCISYEVDCGKLAKEIKLGEEETGRMVRYEKFSETAKQIELSGVPGEKIAVAVAQNANDQSETVMFRIIRGTGIHGLSGIRETRKDQNGYNVIRPLLNVERIEIEDYIKENNLIPNIDKSNFETHYSRNKIRLELFPYIKENLNGNIEENLRRLSSTASVEDDYMELMANKVYNRTVTEKENGVFEVNTELLNKEHKALKRRVISKLLGKCGIRDELSYNTIIEIEKIVMTDMPSAHLDLAGSYTAKRNYNNLIFSKNNGNTDKKKHGKPEFEISVITYKDFKKRKADNFAAFDYSAFENRHPNQAENIVLRTRKEGDYIAIKDGKRKKIQDFFVDEKVNKEDRDNLYMTAVGSEILWVLPSSAYKNRSLNKKGKYSQNYHLENNAERVLFLELKESLC